MTTLKGPQQKEQSLDALCTLTAREDGNGGKPLMNERAASRNNPFHSPHRGGPPDGKRPTRYPQESNNDEPRDTRSKRLKA
eukprot:6482932-Amphidinium_carterae.2